MLSSHLLPLQPFPTRPTTKVKSTRVRIVMPLLQLLGELDGGREDQRVGGREEGLAKLNIIDRLGR